MSTPKPNSEAPPGSDDSDELDDTVSDAIVILENSDVSMEDRVDEVVDTAPSDDTARIAIIEHAVRLTQDESDDDLREQVRELLKAAKQYNLDVGVADIREAKIAAEETPQQGNDEPDDRGDLVEKEVQDSPESDLDGENEDIGDFVNIEGDDPFPGLEESRERSDEVEAEIIEEVGERPGEEDGEMEATDSDEVSNDEDAPRDGEASGFGFSISSLIEDLTAFVGGDEDGDSDSEVALDEVDPTASEHQLQEEIIEGEDSTRPTARERSLPQDEFLIYDRLTRESTLAQDTLGFDYVRDDGIIVEDEDHLGLVEVHPRNWLVLNDAERTAVFRAFMSFLLGLKYPIQIAAIPREFDISKHTEKIRIADSLAKRNEESPILRHGRRRQVHWMNNTIDKMSVKDRDFYIITRVNADHVNAQSGAKNPFQGVPVLGELYDSLAQSTLPVRPRRRRRADLRTQERCVKEVRARQNELSETLTKTGVSARIVSDRNEAMDILYRHYNHVESPFSTYNHATYTKLLSNALSEGPDS